MDRKLQLLDSFSAVGADGQHYKVMAYEHLVRVAPPLDGQEHWEATGRMEYRLADGARIDALPDGSLRLHARGVLLRAEARV
jgi:hypothetical protein